MVVTATETGTTRAAADSIGALGVKRGAMRREATLATVGARWQPARVGDVGSGRLC